ncbi:hypothetical protein RCL1_007950 [Eukaryota sp. TZLM3-RCL]
MGPSPSKPDRLELLPVGVKSIGLTNLTNSCPFSSLVQVLYHLDLFRASILSLNQESEQNLASAFRNLFAEISAFPRDFGVIEPHHFISYIRSSNDQFSNAQEQHDCHEFLSFVLSQIPSSISSLFQGTACYTTSCLSCDFSSSSTQSFYELPLELSHRPYSLLHSFNNLLRPETLEDFVCDSCGGVSSSQRIMKVKKFPYILIFHLKRFKYDQNSKNLFKISTNMTISQTISLPCHGDVAVARFRLKAIISHVGNSFFSGHYFAIVGISENLWVIFDDDRVKIIFDYELANYFGSLQDEGASAYIVFYEKEEEQ